MGVTEGKIVCLYGVWLGGNKKIRKNLDEGISLSVDTPSAFSLLIEILSKGHLFSVLFSLAQFLLAHFSSPEV